VELELRLLSRPCGCGPSCEASARLRRNLSPWTLWLALLDTAGTDSATSAPAPSFAAAPPSARAPMDSPSVSASWTPTVYSNISDVVPLPDLSAAAFAEPPIVRARLGAPPVRVTGADVVTVTWMRSPLTYVALAPGVLVTSTRVTRAAGGAGGEGRGPLVTRKAG